MFRSATGLLFCDADLNVFAADGMFLEMFGLQQEEVIGVPASSVLGHPDLREEFLRNGMQDELVRTSRESGVRTLRLNVSPIHLEDTVNRDGLVISVEDVTC
jgi:PAS domain S-box-containing protein